MAIFWRTIDKSLLEPKFVADLDAFLGASPFNWYVMEGYRSPQRSAELFDEYKNGLWVRDANHKPLRNADGSIKRQYTIEGKLIRGPRAAPANASAHNFGLAIDVVPDERADVPGLQPTWKLSFPAWAWLKTNSIPHPRLKNGWSFNDWPHIERFNWKKFTQWKG